ncbi:HAD family hydrolase [Saccharomonospora halophila]|uniref:HAD family hydrolase n=1 Tax=Saccharomonospora halophila TaxID=129922 RepID=UPI000367F98D
MPTTRGTGLSWVVFDYGEVLSERTAALPELAGLLGVPQARFESAYWAHREAYDRGATDHAYWQAVADTVGTEVDAATTERLTRTDIAGWSRLAPGTPDLLAALERDGHRLALLSNAPAAFAAHTRRQPWLRRFSEVLFSAETGVAKPDPEIFDLLLDRLGADGGECLFVDDREVNVHAARTAGLNAHLWPGTTDALPLIRSCSPGVVP